MCNASVHVMPYPIRYLYTATVPRTDVRVCIHASLLHTSSTSTVTAWCVRHHVYIPVPGTRNLSWLYVRYRYSSRCGVVYVSRYLLYVSNLNLCSTPYKKAQQLSAAIRILYSTQYVEKQQTQNYTGTGSMYKMDVSSM